MKNEEAKKLVNNFIQKTEQIRKNREIYFNEFNKFIKDGDQWTNTEEPDEGKIKLTLNNAEDVINTYKAKMFPRNQKSGTMKIGVTIFEKDETTKEKYKNEIIETYDEEKISKKILEQVENFLVGGAACFYYPQNPITKKAKIISLDPRFINLNFDEYGEINQFAFIDFIDKEKNANNWLNNLINRAIKKSDQREIKRITYWDKNYQIIIAEEEIEIKENKNKLIPFSWIPNSPKAHTHEGYSEGYNIKKLDKEINFRTSDFGGRIKENTTPNLAIYTDKDTDNISRDERGILPLGQDDKAEFLKLTENKEVLEYINEIKKTIRDKKAINSATTGEIKSNVSGLTMAYYFSPLLDRIGLKRIYWVEAFKELNNAILNYKFGHKYYRTEPVFESVLVSDESTKIDNTIKRLNNNLVSHTEAINELGEENAEKKFKEILIEKEKIKEIENKQKEEEQYITI